MQSVHKLTNQECDRSIENEINKTLLFDCCLDGFMPNTGNKNTACEQNKNNNLCRTGTAVQMYYEHQSKNAQKVLAKLLLKSESTMKLMTFLLGTGYNIVTSPTPILWSYLINTVLHSRHISGDTFLIINDMLRRPKNITFELLQMSYPA